MSHARGRARAGNRLGAHELLCDCKPSQLSRVQTVWAVPGPITCTPTRQTVVRRRAPQPICVAAHQPAARGHGLLRPREPLGRVFAGDLRAFPGHQELLAFLHAFAEESRLTRCVKLSAEMVHVASPLVVVGRG